MQERISFLRHVARRPGGQPFADHHHRLHSDLDMASPFTIEAYNLYAQALDDLSRGRRLSVI